MNIMIWLEYNVIILPTYTFILEKEFFFEL